MPTDVLKYIFLLAAVVGGISALRKWQQRRKQMRRIYQSLSKKIDADKTGSD
jgi:hypothetical protein